MCEVLRVNSSLTSLNLTRTNFGNDVASVINSAVRDNYTLTYLNLFNIAFETEKPLFVVNKKIPFSEVLDSA